MRRPHVRSTYDVVDMRRPGFEPGLSRWQRDVLTTVLPALEDVRKTPYLRFVGQRL